MSFRERRGCLKNRNVPFLESASIALYLVLVLANTLLSYSSLGLLWKSAIFLLFVLLPLFLASSQGAVPEGLSPQPLGRGVVWGLSLLALLGFAIRFYRLEDLSTWPLMEEGLNGFLALEAADQNKYQFFNTYAQYPPFYIWSLGLFFKLFGISLTTLFLFPALLSALTALVPYWVTRPIYGSPVAALFALLTAISFWPIYCGRFCSPGSLVMFFIFLAFGCVWLLWQEKDPSAKKTRAILLGVVIGSGFYTFTTWPLLAVWLVLTVLWHEKGWKKEKTGLSAALLLPILLMAAPYFYEVIHQNFGVYLISRFAGDGQGPAPSLFFVLRESLSYFTGLFWGCADQAAFGPIWGGFLNPLLASAFFIGAAELIHRWKEKWARWILVSFFVLLLPGVLTKSPEMFRVGPVLPILLFVSAWGLWSVAARFERARRGWVLGAILLLSFALDAAHLTYFYPVFWRTPSAHWQGAKSPERYRAFQILSATEKKLGPGLVLDSFSPDTMDQTLTLATYPFNAAVNRAIDRSEVRWVAVIVNVHFQPYLAKEFSGSQWVWLSADQDRLSGGLSLGLIPFDAQDRERIDLWVKADAGFRDCAAEGLHQSWGEPETRIMKKLFAVAPLLGQDRFLKACFWQKAFIGYTADGNLEQGLQSAQNSIDQGYPTALAYNEIGLMLEGKKDIPGARNAFEKALHCQLNHTNAQLNLEGLNSSKESKL